MSTTKNWAESMNVPTEADVPAIGDYSEAYARTAREVAIRAIILQGVVAVAYGVKAQPINDWFREQGILSEVTPQERLMIGETTPAEAKRIAFQWKQEAQWTLLWMIQRVESLGLPTGCCDTKRLVDEIMPGLGDDFQGFLDQAELRSPGALLAEDDRTYNLWCNAHAALRRRESLPNDLNLSVLRERRYAFEWMDGNQEWDDVTCDA